MVLIQRLRLHELAAESVWLMLNTLHLKYEKAGCESWQRVRHAAAEWVLLA